LNLALLPTSCAERTTWEESAWLLA
jgi:hypothetical protein